MPGVDRMRATGAAAGSERLSVIDMHTAGEPVRIVVSGYPELQADTLLRKRREALEKHDHIRRRLMLEPRGHGGMYGVIPTRPSVPGAALGVLFTHAAGYSTMCGHATLAIARWAIDSGRVPATWPETHFVLECPCGPIEVFARRDDRGVVTSGFESVPAFAEPVSRTIDVPGRGPVAVDVAYGGAYYAILPASRLAFDFGSVDLADAVTATADVYQAALAQVRIEPSGNPDVEFLYGVILADDAPWPEPTRNICVFAGGQIDRSPTGSGVTARMALDVLRNGVALDNGRDFVGPTGESFRGTAVRRSDRAAGATVTVKVEGTSYYTGETSFIFEPADPLMEGFILTQETKTR